MSQADGRLAEVVAAVLASPKYRAISPDLVRHVGAQELAKRRTTREAIKATRNKLHQVAGAYVERVHPYAAWLAALEEAARAGDAAVRAHCRTMLAYHASTQERLPILEQFFQTTLAPIAPVRSVADLACGLNPLAIPWMPLAPGATYRAYDIYADMVDFLTAAMALLPVQGQAAVRDVTQYVPAERVDVAFLLKAIPCLEQLDKAGVRRLLAGVPAAHLLISFPVRSLGGRGKGMPAHYDALFHELVAERGWAIRRFDFASELAYLVTT